MSMFDNVIFDEFTLLEGEQADEYRKRKEDERIKKVREERNRKERRYGFDSPLSGKWNDKASSERRNRGKELTKADRDLDMSADSIRNLSKATNKFHNYKVAEKEAHDAANRHDRRHPKQYTESAFKDIDFK